MPPPQASPPVAALPPLPPVAELPTKLVEATWAEPRLEIAPPEASPPSVSLDVPLPPSALLLQNWLPITERVSPESPSEMAPP